MQEGILSLSEYRGKFILKGGMPVAAMVGLDARSTMDIDAAVKGATVSIEEAENMIASIISVPADDGVKFCISIRVIRPRKNRADNLV